MAAAALRHYSASLGTTAATTVVTAVPTARALVIGKVTVAASAPATITLTAGANNIATALSLTAGQVYTETNLVLIATETLAATASVANALVVSVFGEEVDN